MLRVFSVACTNADFWFVLHSRHRRLRSFDGEGNRGQFSIMMQTREAIAKLDFASGKVKTPKHVKPDEQKWA